MNGQISFEGVKYVIGQVAVIFEWSQELIPDICPLQYSRESSPVHMGSPAMLKLALNWRENIHFNYFIYSVELLIFRRNIETHCGNIN